MRKKGLDRTLKGSAIGDPFMFLQEKQTGTLVEILDVQALINPAKPDVSGRVQEGQEEQDPESYSKDALIFPSGENLPRCWIDAEYRTNS
jgi:hypothetical protein